MSMFDRALSQNNDEGNRNWAVRLPYRFDQRNGFIARVSGGTASLEGERPPWRTGKLFYSIPMSWAAETIQRSNFRSTKADLRSHFLELDGRSIGEDLCGTLADHRRSEPDAYHRVRAQGDSFITKSVEGLFAGLPHEFGVLRDLTSDDIFERRENILTEVPCSYRVSTDKTDRFRNFPIWQSVSRRHNHRSISL